MQTEELIKQLKKSNLYAECQCGGEFKLSTAILFDGTKPFPPAALELKKQLEESLEERIKELKKVKELATKKAEITTKAVNVGKELEKIILMMKEFKWELPDCRVLGDPIDIITFNGLYSNKVNSLTFIEVKSGGAHLNEHQKSIKDAIEDGRVSYKECKNE
jgi:predicted Holliday junction resolvase-like endonuclease